MSDATWHDRLKLIGEDYLRLADDRLWLARRQADFWALQARIEQRQAERLDWRPKPKRTPSGHFAAVTVELDHSRAADEEHRPTPVVPDPRREGT